MSDKNQKGIQLNFSQIIALDNPELEAFSNAFSYHDDTFFHKSMGSLFGIIQILDHSEQSEYIPNLLTSIIKKEFYSQSARSTEESFEAALKKANLALADLAEHDIVNWSGKLHALIGVFKKNKLYFTQVGNSSMILGRDKKLLNLSDQNNSPASHPIKTFKDVVVGEIKPQDKIIVTGPTVYNIFKFSDLARLFDTFNNQEFDNLIIKTIEKEADNATVLIVNAKQQISTPTTELSNEQNNNSDTNTLEKLTRNKNFLGKDIKKTKAKTISEKKSSDKVTTNSKNKTAKKKEKVKTLKKDATPENENKPRVTNVPLEKPATAKFPKKNPSKKNETKHSSVTPAKKINNSQQITSPKAPKKTKKYTPKKQKTSKIKNALLDKPTVSSKMTKLDGVKPKKQDSPKKDLSPFEQTPEIYISDEDENVKKAKKKISKKKLKQFFNTSNKNNQPVQKPIKKEINNAKTVTENENITAPVKTHPSEDTTTNEQASPNNFWLLVQDKTFNIIKKIKQTGRNSLLKIKDLKQLSPGEGSNLSKYTTPIKVVGKNIKHKVTTTNFKKNTPSDIINFVKTNRIIIVLLSFLVLVPLIIFQITKHKSNNKTAETKQNIPVTTTSTPTESIIKDLTPTKVVATLPDNIKFISGNNDTLLALSDSGEIYEISKNNKITKIEIPSNINIGDTKSIAYMSSLNLFFFTSNSQVLSYSPVTHKFYKNKITLPNKFDLIAQGTYLDYLYLLDKNSKQIYRYPRATGGFGEAKTWLKTPLSTTNGLTGMAIDDTIRLVYEDGKVETYFKNKLAKNANLSTKQLNYIYTNTTLSNYYVLSKETGKILQINKDTNKVIKEYQNKKITNTNNIFVNEITKKIYFVDGKALNSIDF